MDCSIAAVVIAGVLVGNCPDTPADQQQITPPFVEAEGMTDDQQPTAGSVPAMVPVMDDRFGHDDRFGADVPQRSSLRRKAR